MLSWPRDVKTIQYNFDEYTLDRKTANISDLSSGNMNKYEFERTASSGDRTVTKSCDFHIHH